MTDELLEATVSIRGVVLAGRGETLLVQRASDGAWELPGGRLGPEEDVEAGLRREMQEETTLTVEVGGPVHANAWQNTDDDGRFAVYYSCRTDDRDVELSEEHRTHRWVPYADAGSLLPGPAAEAVRRARTDGDEGLAMRPSPPATSN